jgi:hypothetical protein
MASIASNDALILSHRPNPLRWDFRERQDATAHLALQHDQLMSKRGILCFKPALRLEERGNHVQPEGYQRGHSH